MFISLIAPNETIVMYTEMFRGGPVSKMQLIEYFEVFVHETQIKCKKIVLNCFGLSRYH